MRKETDVGEEIDKWRILLYHLLVAVDSVAYCHEDIEANADWNNQIFSNTMC